MDNKIILILTILICLGIVFFDFEKVKAETYSGDIITGEYVPNMYIKKLKQDGNGKYQQGRVLRRSSDNVFVYCLQPFVDINNDYVYDITTDDYATILNITQEQWQRISLLSYYGYQYGNHTDLKWYYITQVLIWRTAEPMSNIFFTNTLNGTRNDNLYSSEIAEIEDLVAKHYVIPNFNLSDITMTLGQTITLNDSNNILSRFNISQQNNILASISNNQLNITATNIGEISLTLSKTDSKYTTPPIVYYSDNTQNVMVVGRYDPVNLKITGQVNGGRIKITKVDSETNSTNPQGIASLTGAIYNVYDSNNNIVSTLIIGSDSTAITDYLPLGTYTVREESSSIGYYLDSTVYTIDVNSNNIFNLTVKEEVIKGRIKLIKIDKDSSTSVAQGEATLVGAKYQILDSNNNVVDTLIIGDDCTATSKLLPYGKYKIKEISSSKGYHLNTEIYSQFIEEELIYSVEVEEEVIKNQFNFYKFYGNESTGIIYSEANALFEVVNKEGIVVTTFKTDKNGYAKLILPYGDYVVKQVSGLEDYKLMYPFSISVSETTSLNQTNYLKNGPITARLKLIKIDSETGLSINIAGAKFKIRNQKTNEYICQTTDKIICEFETNENGIMISPLPLFGGDYIIEEIKAPNGYILSNEELTFSLKKNQDIIEDEVYGSMIEVVFENTQVKGNLIIHKTGEKVEIKDNTFIYKEIDLSDVVFEIRANEDIIIGSKKYYSKDELVATLRTNENGIIELSNLPLGKYTVKEISTKDNHILNSTIYELELKYQDQYTEIIYKELEIKNSLQTGELEFTKTDLTTGKVIPNVKVNIYTENDKLIYSGYTDKEGKIIIKDLFVGKFYIIETETVEGYVLSNEKVYFEIKENGEIVKANMTNNKISSKIIFHKTDENGNSLAGVKIGIYDLDENEIGIYTTNEKGIIEVELEYNKYMYKELETLNGYILDEEKHYFNVTQDGEVIELNLINKLKEIEIPNTSSNSNFISISVLMLGIGIVLFIISNKKNKKV